MLVNRLKQVAAEELLNNPQFCKIFNERVELINKLSDKLTEAGFDNHDVGELVSVTEKCEKIAILYCMGKII